MQERRLYLHSEDPVYVGFVANNELSIHDLVQNYLENKPGAETALTNRLLTDYQNPTNNEQVLVEIALLERGINQSEQKESKLDPTRKYAVLGLLYLQKSGVYKIYNDPNIEDINNSRRYCRQAIPTGNSLALFVRGYLERYLYRGTSEAIAAMEADVQQERETFENLQADNDLTEFLLKKAIDKGSSAAKTRLAKLALDQTANLIFEEQREQAIQLTLFANNLLLKAIKEHDTEACLLLASITEDTVKSKYFEEQAAQYGNIRALAKLVHGVSSEKQAAYIRSHYHLFGAIPIVAQIVGFDLKANATTDPATIYELSLFYHITSIKQKLRRLINDNFAIFDQLSNQDDWADVKKGFSAKPDLPDISEEVFQRKQHYLALKILSLQKGHGDMSIIELIDSFVGQRVHPSYLVNIEAVIANLDPKQTQDLKAEECCNALKKVVLYHLNYLKKQIEQQLHADYFKDKNAAKLFRKEHLTRIYDTPLEQLTNELDKKIKNNKRVMKGYKKLRAISKLYGPVKVKADPQLKLEKFEEQLKLIEEKNVLNNTPESKGEPPSQSSRLFHTSLAPQSGELVKEARQILDQYRFDVPIKNITTPKLK